MGREFFATDTIEHQS